LRDVVNDGVIGVDLEVADGNKSVVVHSVRGDFRLSTPRDRRKGHQADAPRDTTIEGIAGQSQTLLSLGILLFISSLPVRTWICCVCMTYRA
jgi:hypothetical protein